MAIHMTSAQRHCFLNVYLLHMSTFTLHKNYVHIHYTVLLYLPYNEEGQHGFKLFESDI